MYRKSQHILPEKSHNLKKKYACTIHTTYKSNTTVLTCRDGTAYTSGSSQLTLGFSAVRFSLFLVFCVMFCESLCSFFLFRYRIVSSVLPYAVTTYRFWYLKNSLTKSLIYSLFTQFRIFFKRRIAHLLFNYLAG